jgi:hypothetical protein
MTNLDQNLFASKKQAVDLKLLVRVLAKRYFSHYSLSLSLSLSLFLSHINSFRCLEKSKGSTTEFETARELVANTDRMSPELLLKLSNLAQCTDTRRVEKKKKKKKKKSKRKVKKKRKKRMKIK